MSLTSRRLLIIIALLAVQGIIVSSVSLDHHFRKSKTSYCDFGQSFNCDIVNRSEYSTIAGVPVALIGAELIGSTIERRTMRGIESQGMLVSASEVGLGNTEHGAGTLIERQKG